jgi:hypothetical protein
VYIGVVCSGVVPPLGDTGGVVVVLFDVILLDVVEIDGGEEELQNGAPVLST